MEVTPGFVLLTAWFALVNGGGVLMLVLSASTVHELGHWLVLRLLGAHIQAFRLTALGAELTANSGRLSYGGELLAVLAGPGANLAAALFTCPYARWMVGGRSSWRLPGWRVPVQATWRRVWYPA